MGILMRSQRKIMFGGVACMVAAIIQLTYMVHRGGHLFTDARQLFLGIGAICFTAISAAAVHITTLKCDPRSNVPTILLRYALRLVLSQTYKRHWKTFDAATGDCVKAQEDFLLQTLRGNEDTIYGRDAKFEVVYSVADFVRSQPLTKYEHYADYINRVAEGDDDVLSKRKPVVLGTTSGTTGTSKLFPVSAEGMVVSGASSVAIAEELRKKHFSGSVGPLQRTCFVISMSPIRKSVCGLPIGPLTSFIFPDFVRRLVFSTPIEGTRIMHEPTAMYIHALFALRDENLGTVSAPFVSSIFIFFQCIEACWQSLIRDIREGSISKDRVPLLCDTDRETLRSYLEPMPERAMTIEREFRSGFEGIVRRIWPHVTMVICTTSGSMQSFAMLTKKYTGDIPIMSMFYVSTEGLLGLACEFPDDGQTEYVCIPNEIFYEFIPVDHCDEVDPKTLLMHEVTIGERYEIVITSKDGLYRYRMGDVIKITGYLNQTPKFAFHHRTGEVMNLRSEKTSEVQISTALTHTVETREGTVVINYACADSPLFEEASGKASNRPSPYYVIFIEISTPAGTVLQGQFYKEKFENEFDKNLRQSVDYDKFRRTDALSPLRVVFVDSSAFSGLRDHLVQTSNASPVQIKLPKKLRKLDWVKVLLQHEL